MNNSELKTAFASKENVIYNGILYKRIHQIVYTLDEKDNLIISANLLDMNKNSVTLARASLIWPAKKQSTTVSGKMIGRMFDAESDQEL